MPILISAVLIYGFIVCMGLWTNCTESVCKTAEDRKKLEKLNAPISTFCLWITGIGPMIWLADRYLPENDPWHHKQRSPEQDAWWKQYEEDREERVKWNGRRYASWKGRCSGAESDEVLNKVLRDL